MTFEIVLQSMYCCRGFIVVCSPSIHLGEFQEFTAHYCGSAALLPTHRSFEPFEYFTRLSKASNECHLI